jgi:ADP-L-glycero-D-manno-heptose 6-epimerase
MKHSHDLSKGKILVTGAAGLIGSAIVAELNHMGINDILITDYLGNDDRFKNLVPLKFNDYMEADSCIKLLQESSYLFNDIHTVFHLGACSSTTEKNGRFLIENNYEYTKTLAQWAYNNHIRFIYASSAATYGDGSQGMDDKDTNLSKFRPLNMYGYSKHLFDLFAQKQGLFDEIVGIKYFNVFGPNEHHKGDMRSVVHKAFEQISQTSKVQLFKSYHPNFKDGEQVRDFLYVKDAAQMTIHLAQNKSAHGIFNLGSGIANTWLSLARAIFKAMNKPENIEFIDMPDYLKPKYQYYTKADISKLRNSGFKEEITPLDIAVQDYVQNYLITGKYLGD